MHNTNIISVLFISIYTPESRHISKIELQDISEEIMSSIGFAILLVLGIGHVNSFCFHAGGGIGEYHSDCSDSIGGW